MSRTTSQSIWSYARLTCRRPRTALLLGALVDIDNPPLSPDTALSARFMGDLRWQIVTGLYYRERPVFDEDMATNVEIEMSFRIDGLVRFATRILPLYAHADVRLSHSLVANGQGFPTLCGARMDR
jgi:hypothetical protein